MVIGIRPLKRSATAVCGCSILAANSSSVIERSARIRVIVSPGADAQLGQNGWLFTILHLNVKELDPTHARPIYIAGREFRIRGMIRLKNGLTAMRKGDTDFGACRLTYWAHKYVMDGDGRSEIRKP
jgi:hypothetical protein